MFVNGSGVYAGRASFGDPGWANATDIGLVSRRVSTRSTPLSIRITASLDRREYGDSRIPQSKRTQTVREITIEQFGN